MIKQASLKREFSDFWAQRQASCRQLLRVVAPFERILVMAHDNPDPDAIASGWALKYLLEAQLERDVGLVAGGEIVRAENRKMIDLLKPPLRLEDITHVTPDTLVILVDSSAGASNHPKLDPEIQPVAVIDHHEVMDTASPALLFQEIRPNVAATATIIGSYLRVLDIEPPVNLATAMVYAIRTETRGGESRYSALDHAMLTWLTGRANPSYLALIEDAPLTVRYFSDLVLALQSAFIYGNCAFCVLPQSQGPEVVGEMADLLIRCDEVESVLCGTIYEGNLILSVRTDRTSRRNAARLTLKVLEGIGHGGGHSHRAGGIIHNVERLADQERAFAILRSRWLAACDCSGRRGVRLVPRRHIIRHL